MIDKETIQKLKERKFPFKNNDGKWGYTDIFGRIVVPAQFDEIEESRYYVKGAKDYDKDLKSNMTLRDFLNNRTEYKIGNSLKIDEEALEEIFIYSPIRDMIHEDKHVRFIREDASLFEINFMGVFEYGYETLDGKPLTDCAFEDIFPFSEGVARVAYNTYHDYLWARKISVKELEEKLDKNYFKPFLQELSQWETLWGYMNSEGKQIVIFAYDNASDFHEGVAAVSKDGSWGYIDKNENIIIPFCFDWADPFEDGFARVLFAGLYYIIDKDGLCYESFEDLEIGNGSKFYL